MQQPSKLSVPPSSSSQTPLQSSSTPSSSTSSTKESSKKSNSQLKIMEWRFNQFLGEKITYEQIRYDPENESFLVTNVKFTQDGLNVIVSDKGGRVIIFKKSDAKVKQPKLNYFFEYQAQEKDFDVHKSIEYPEEIKGLCVYQPCANDNKLDILTAGYRTIKLDRIYESKVRSEDDFAAVAAQSNNNNNSGAIYIPSISAQTGNSEIKTKTKKMFCCTHSNEINSLSLNKTNINNFISSDEFRVYLWDINHTGKDVYTPIDIEPENEAENENAEKITRSVYSNMNPHVFLYGTNKGNIKVCDLRSGSSQNNFNLSFSDEKSNITHTIANSLLSIHDFSTNSNNMYSFATRNYFSINLWDMRKSNEPTSKLLIYEPIINKLTYIYQNSYINDKFTLDTDPSGKFILTGGYNNMFHVIDIEQRLNSQIRIDDSNEKLMNTNVIRKINAKGSCYYKKDDPNISNIDFNKKILYQAYSPVDNFALLAIYNCIYTYSGNIAKKK